MHAINGVEVYRTHGTLESDLKKRTFGAYCSLSSDAQSKSDIQVIHVVFM